MNMAESVDDGGSKKHRVTVSLAPDVASGLEAAAGQAGARSVSAYVEQAVRDRMRRDEWLARWEHLAGPVDPHALEYARRALTGALDQHPRAS